MVRPLSEIVCCPQCRGPLKDGEHSLTCVACVRDYPVVDGIPQLFVSGEPAEASGDVTGVVKEFYERTPFPNYDDMDSRDSLRAKAKRGIFADLLDHQLPPDALVLEAGCGTGQLSNFLGMHWQRRVIGADMCMNSLRLAKGFRDRFSINNAEFLQMNLFQPPFPDQTFDVIISNGVLHHTPDAREAFRSLAAKLNPGGIFIVGLYNHLGRLPTLWRRRLIELFGDRLSVLDSRLRRKDLNEGRWAAWFRDQYKHPHETRHSYSEVLTWFEALGFKFLSAIPSTDGNNVDRDFRLFSPHSPGSSASRLVTELSMLLSGGTDGGLYIVIGQKA